jgi:hypothetical protein
LPASDNDTTLHVRFPSASEPRHARDVLLCFPRSPRGSRIRCWRSGCQQGLLADHCSVCHAIPGYSASPPAAGLAAPAFDAIANDSAVYTEERLRVFLQKPHWPMTGMILSPSDIDNFNAYLTTLRRR